MSFLEKLTSAVGEELGRLRGHLLTRLDAQALGKAQLGRGTGTASSVDGLTVTLSSGSFPADATTGRTFRMLSGALAGEEATIAARTDATTLVLVGPGVGAAFTDESWEVERPADTSVEVESTLYWPDAGEFFLDGVRYRFTGRTTSTLVGLEHWDVDTWVIGVHRTLPARTVLADYTRNRTALDLLRRSFFVETATAPGLEVLGANHGRPRPPGLTDTEAFRAWLRATMFGAVGTREHVYHVLDAVVGADAWETFEDFTHPTDDYARIFVRRLDEDATAIEGRGILDGDAYAVASSSTTVTAPEEPTKVGAVALAPDVSARLVAAGSGASTTDGISVSGASSARIRPGDRFEVLDGPLAGEYGYVRSYTHPGPIVLGPVQGHGGEQLSGASASFRWQVTREVTDCRFARASDDTALEWPDDSGTQAWEWQGTQLETVGAVLASSGALGDRLSVGSSVATATGWYRRQARITAESEGVLELLVAADPASIASPTDGLQACLEIHDGERALSVGLLEVTAGVSVRFALVNATTGAAIASGIAFAPDADFRTVEIRKRGREAVELVVDGRVEATAAYASFATTTVHELRFGCRSTANPARLQVRHVAWCFATNTDFWAARATSATTAGTPSANIGGLGGMLQVGDVGKTLQVSGGTARNAGGGTVNGEWEVTARVDANTADVTGPTRTGATVRRGYPGVIFLPEDLALAFPDALGHTLELLDGDHAGTYPITALLDGELRDLAAPEGTDLDTLPISAATVFDRATAVRVSGAPVAWTATDDEFSWRLVPVFPADTGLHVELSDAGSVVGAALTLRQALPITSPLPLLALSYTTVTSGHVEAEGARNDADTPRWPLYLYDAWGLARDVIQSAGAAGILVDLDSLQRDAAGLHVVED